MNVNRKLYTVKSIEYHFHIQAQLTHECKMQRRLCKAAGKCILR